MACIMLNKFITSCSTTEKFTAYLQQFSQSAYERVFGEKKHLRMEGVFLFPLLSLTFKLNMKCIKFILNFT